MDQDDDIEEARMASVRLELEAARFQAQEAARRRQRFLMLFREVPLTEAEKRPDPDYGL